MNERYRKLLQSLVNSEQWTALINIAEEVKLDIKKENIMKDTAEETFKAAALQEGEIRGIKRFIDNIFLTIE